MLAKVCKKKINKKAFTLGETLVAMLIMLMVSSILVTGIPAAKNAYDKIVIKSNAEILMSTATYALRNEMSAARDIVVDSDHTTITYLSGTYGSGSEISIDNSNGIMYQRYAKRFDDQEDQAESPRERLVSEYAGDKLIVKYNSVDPPNEDGVITFHGLSVYKASNGNNLTEDSDDAEEGANDTVNNDNEEETGDDETGSVEDKPIVTRSELSIMTF